MRSWSESDSFGLAYFGCLGVGLGDPQQGRTLERIAVSWQCSRERENVLPWAPAVNDRGGGEASGRGRRGARSCWVLSATGRTAGFTVDEMRSQGNVLNRGKRRSEPPVIRISGCAVEHGMWIDKGKPSPSHSHLGLHPGNFCWLLLLHSSASQIPHHPFVFFRNWLQNCSGREWRCILARLLLFGNWPWSVSSHSLSPAACLKSPPTPATCYVGDPLSFRIGCVPRSRIPLKFVLSKCIHWNKSRGRT